MLVICNHTRLHPPLQSFSYQIFSTSPSLIASAEELSIFNIKLSDISVIRD